REHGKSDFIAEKTALQATIKRNHRCVIEVGIRRALLEIEREHRKTFLAVLLLILSSGKTEYLKNLKPVFPSKPVIRQQWISKIKFLRVRAGIQRVRNERMEGPLRFLFALLATEQRAHRFDSPTGCESQLKLVDEWAVLPFRRARKGRTQQTRAKADGYQIYCARHVFSSANGKTRYSKASIPPLFPSDPAPETCPLGLFFGDNDTAPWLLGGTGGFWAVLINV